MTQINDIREAFFMKGRNISEISRDFGIDRKTVRKYISKDDFSDILPEKTNSIPQPKLDPDCRCQVHFFVYMKLPVPEPLKSLDFR
jgi:hypothetical protein